MTPQDTMRLALERAIQLCQWVSESPHQRGSINGMAAQVQHELREALAQQGEQQPVGTIESRTYEDGTPAGNVVNWVGRNAENDFPDGTKLYAGAAPSAQPLLIDSYINDAHINASDMPNVVVEKLQAAINRAHGIGVQK